MDRWIAYESFVQIVFVAAICSQACRAEPLGRANEYEVLLLHEDAGSLQDMLSQGEATDW